LENQHRSLFKTISWRCIATITTITIVYAFTRKIPLSLGIGGVEVVSKMILYYFHERIWNLITWGRIKKPVPDYD
jgi:uncharacterized membrane protein